MIDFPQAQYNKWSIQALLGSPVKKLHRTGEADDLITDIFRAKYSKRLRKYDVIGEKFLTALIYIDKGYYPVATTLLQEAVELAGKDDLPILPSLEKAYEALLEGPYGKEREVAEVGLQLLLVQMPHLFES
jgi:hypothetical protein